MAGPLYSSDEMGTTREKLLETLNNIKEYKILFKGSFSRQGS
jgi:cytochrome c peroxidase